MTKDLKEIREKLVAMLKEHSSVFKVDIENDEKFTVSGTVETMQGKQKVDGIYFSTVLMKPKDVRFYFFPAYTHKDELGELPENVNKFLKGKSCFHVKHLDDEIEQNFKAMIDKSVKLYQADGLLSN